jgi:Papain family cysteine protease
MSTRVAPLALLAVLAAGSLGCSPTSAAPQRYPIWQPPPGAAFPGAAPLSPQGPQAQASAFPVNVQALLALAGTRCAPREVAPGEWVRFDCGGIRPILKAIGLVIPNRSALFPTLLPPAIDHRADGSEGPIKDQGAVGACTAFSLSTAMDHGVRRMGRADVVAPLHVWSKYAVPEMGEAGDDTVDQSITVETTWPYDPAKACKLERVPFDSCGQAYGVASNSASLDPRLRAEQATADASGRYRLLGIEQLHAQPADPNEIAAVIAGGDDVWASFSVNDDAWSHRSLNSSVIPDYVPDDDSGHAVVLAGYRTLVTGTRQFLVHNSWSKSWGEGGYGWISEAMVTQYLRAAYKVRVADASAPVGPAPSSGCPSGQVKDAVLGTCAPLCASGSPPAAGVCLPALPGFPGFPAPGQPPSAPSGPLPFPLPFPFPLPQPGAAPASCPQGQAPDLMTGQCINLCPNGAPAIGGMCLPLGH